MPPFFIYTDENPPGLYKLSDGRFQLTKNGEVAAFMAGYGYLLVENGLAQFLEQLNVERISVSEAIIWDRLKNVEYRSHQQILINQHFSWDDRQDLNVDGIRMLMMDNKYPFVSAELKAHLDSSDFPYLKFSEGFDGWTGEAQASNK